MTYSIVYLRPDGWWEAGKGWTDPDDAIADGEGHEWHGCSWGVVPTKAVKRIDGDRRLPLGEEPPNDRVELLNWLHAVEAKSKRKPRH